MIFKSETELASFAEQLGESINPPMIFELIGDVGAGKTTFTRHLAKGLGISAPVTSPSFTISKQYASKKALLIHYDFYRLEDPGLMSAELEEALMNKNAIIVLEWANSVKNLLPENHATIIFKVTPDGSRELIFKNLDLTFLKEQN